MEAEPEVTLGAVMGAGLEAIPAAKPERMVARPHDLGGAEGGGEAGGREMTEGGGSRTGGGRCGVGGTSGADGITADARSRRWNTITGLQTEPETEMKLTDDRQACFGVTERWRRRRQEFQNRTKRCRIKREEKGKDVQCPSL